MRGFPLLNLLLVVAFFVLAWGPLQKAIGDREPAPVENASATSSSTDGTYSLHITSSHPLASLSVSHLNSPLLNIEAPVDLEDDHELVGLKIPPEGVDLWIQASFAGQPNDQQRPVLSIELVPEEVEHELGPVTLWGELGSSEIDAPATILWTSDSAQP